MKLTDLEMYWSRNGGRGEQDSAILDIFCMFLLTACFAQSKDHRSLWHHTWAS